MSGDLKKRSFTQKENRMDNFWYSGCERERGGGAESMQTKQWHVPNQQYVLLKTITQSKLYPPYICCTSFSLWNGSFPRG